MMAKLPEPFEMIEIKTSFPLKREQSLNTVIQQETEKYNKLLNKIIDNLQSILLVQKGEAFSTPEL
jgi:hypothetical protein